MNEERSRWFAERDLVPYRAEIERLLDDLIGMGCPKAATLTAELLHHMRDVQVRQQELADTWIALERFHAGEATLEDVQRASAGLQALWTARLVLTEGEIAAECFERFERNEDLKTIVRDLKVHPRMVREAWHAFNQPLVWPEPTMFLPSMGYLPPVPSPGPPQPHESPGASVLDFSAFREAGLKDEQAAEFTREMIEVANRYGLQTPPEVIPMLTRYFKDMLFDSGPKPPPEGA